MQNNVYTKPLNLELQRNWLARQVVSKNLFAQTIPDKIFGTN